MKKQTDSELRAELLEMAMDQLRILKATSVTDRNFSNIVAKTDSTFNGVGKVIKLAALEVMQKTYEVEGEKVVAKAKFIEKAK